MNIIDNGPHPSEIRTKFQCRFCSEEKGIKIYIDRNSQTFNPLKPALFLTIGWAHLCCLFWNNYMEFVDETKFEIRQDSKII